MIEALLSGMNEIRTYFVRNNLLNVNSEDARKMCEICSKLTIKSHGF